MTQNVLYVLPSDSRARERLPSGADVVATAAAAVDRLRTDPPAGVVTQYRLDGERTGLDVLRDVRERHPTLPVFCWTPDPDAAVASEATALDVTEYRYGEDLPDPEAVLARAGETGETFFNRFYDVTADRDADFQETVERLLSLGCERLDLAYGFLTRIEDGVQAVTVAVGDHPGLQAGESAPLAESYCRRTIESDDLLGIASAEESMAGDPAYERFGLGCYLGGKIAVGGETYGTVCFADEAGRDVGFTAAERGVVEVLARWLGAELERRERDDALETANERLTNVLERIDDAFFALDRDLTFTYVNGAAEELLELPAETLLGHEFGSVLPEGPVEPFRERFERALATQEPVTFEEHSDRVDKRVEVSAFPAEDGLSVYVRDVTEQRRRERTLNELLDVTQELMRADDRQAVADLTCEAAERVLGFRLNLVRLYDSETAELPVAASTDRPNEMVPRPTYAADEGPPGDALQTGESQFYDDVSVIDDDRDRSPVRAAMYLPLGDQGVLSVASRERGGFDGTDRQVAALLAANATAALQRADREETLRRYETVLETVQNMLFVVDDEGRFVYVTTAFADRVGYDRETLVGEHPGERFGDAVVADAERVLGNLLADGRADGRFETELTTADGEQFPAEVELTLLPGSDGYDGAVGVVRDISDLRATRRELAAENDRFRHLFEQVPDPVVETQFEDGEPIIAAVNPVFESVFGYDEAAVVGRSMNDLVVPEDARDGAVDIDQRAQETGLVSAEVRRETATGVRDFLFRGVTYEASSGHRRGYGVYTDITRRKERERRLEVLHTVLRHTLRTEVNIAGGYLELLEADDDVPADVLASIRESLDTLVEVSDRARALERAMDGGERSGTPIDVARHVRDVVDTVRETTPGVTIDAALPDSLYAYGDSRLELALEALLENAVEHSSTSPRSQARENAVEHSSTSSRPHARSRGVDGKRADGEGAAVRVAVRQDPDRPEEWVQIRVSDDGPGIPELERELVTGDREITQLEHGEGLGLWTASWVVGAMGGELGFACDDGDEDGDPSTVVVRLRRAPDPDD